MGYYNDDQLNERILRGNIERHNESVREGERLTPKEVDKAVKIAKEAFHGNVTNGQASEIGIKGVKALRE